MKSDGFDAVIESANRLVNFIDEISKGLVKVEQALRNNFTNVPFSKGPLTFKQDERIKHRCYRLFIVSGDIERPMLETPLDIRVGYVKYVPDFMNSYAKFLEERIEALEALYSGEEKNGRI